MIAADTFGVSQDGGAGSKHRGPIARGLSRTWPLSADRPAGGGRGRRWDWCSRYRVGDVVIGCDAVT